MRRSDGEDKKKLHFGGHLVTGSMWSWSPEMRRMYIMYATCHTLGGNPRSLLHQWHSLDEQRLKALLTHTQHLSWPVLHTEVVKKCLHEFLVLFCKGHKASFQKRWQSTDTTLQPSKRRSGNCYNSAKSSAILLLMWGPGWQQSMEPTED